MVKVDMVEKKKISKWQYQNNRQDETFSWKVKMSHANSGTKNTNVMTIQYYVGCRIFIQVRYK